jgi:adenylyltransferase/sulfurtransferase
MNDDQLLRYSRHILLPQLDVEGQERLLAARVLIIGLGGLGSPVAMYLAGAGIGHLALSDFDKVDVSNLQRQIIHDTSNIGQSKTASAAASIKRLNADVTVSEHGRLEDEALNEQVKLADVVVDASDNFATRFVLNEACVKQQTPLVSAAAIRMEGQVSVFLNNGGDSPCYRCLYKDAGELEETCSANGVLAPLVGILGSIQATEVIKLITGIGEPLSGRLLLLDAESMEWRSLRLKKDPECPVCGAIHKRDAVAR